MSGISIEIMATSDLSDVLAPDERLLWSGNPEHGIRFFEPIGEEKIQLVAMGVGAIVLWSSLPVLLSFVEFGATYIAAVFGAITFLFGLVGYFLALMRQKVLSTSLYIVTDQRAIVCRRDWDWRSGDRLCVVSNPHSVTYPYEVVATRPKPSLRVGSLISRLELLPFGFRLSHPGRPPLWDRLIVPVAFEQISEAVEVLDIIRRNAR